MNPRLLALRPVALLALLGVLAACGRQPARLSKDQEGWVEHYEERLAGIADQAKMMTANLRQDRSPDVQNSLKHLDAELAHTRAMISDMRRPGDDWEQRRLSARESLNHLSTKIGETIGTLYSPESQMKRIEEGP